MLIDWTRVAELRDEIGEDGFSDVVAMFLEESDAVIDRIASGAAPTDADLHFLKGASLNLGFARLAAACQTGVGLVALYRDSKAALLAEQV